MSKNIGVERQFIEFSIVNSTNVDSRLRYWLGNRNTAAGLSLTKISISQTKDWLRSDMSIAHRLNRYFSIIGIKARTKKTGSTLGHQPMIYQPEIGILAFITRRTNDKVEILVQAKTEPGNIGGTQLAPTVQATLSNYSRVHQGKKTNFIEHFINNDNLLKAGTLQSEQGNRFIEKFNRNIILELNKNELEEDLAENWIWVDVKEFLRLLDQDFLVNTDARSVLMSSNWYLLTNESEPFALYRGKNNFGGKLYRSFHSLDHEAINSTFLLLKELSYQRQQREISTETTPLDQLKGFGLNGQNMSINNPFIVNIWHIKVAGREVPEWSQPLLHTLEDEIVKMYCQLKEGILLFLVAYSCEIGFKQSVQFGPSLQVSQTQLAASDFCINRAQVKLHYKFSQSDEGGRFYKSIVHYSLLEIDDEVKFNFSRDHHTWMSLSQIYQLMPYKGNFTNEFRSVLSPILKYII